MRPTLCILFLFLGLSLLSQESASDPYTRSQSFYVQWGYHRSHYQESDIRFTGSDFDFTLKNVRAHDDPSEFETDVYLHWQKFTVPQFNFRLGFFLNERSSISLGWDHMKYVMQRHQRVRIEGTVSAQISEEEAGVYSEQNFDVSPGFMKFEHTDGLNYVRAAYEYHAPVWSDARSLFHLDALLGASAGPVFTWSDATVNGKRYVNWLHLAGWGVSGQLGLRFRYKNTFYLQYQHQTGYIRLEDVIFMENTNRASQSIRFNEQSLVLGAQLPIFVGGNPNK